MSSRPSLRASICFRTSLASPARAVARLMKTISLSRGITSLCGKALPAHAVWPSAVGRFYYARDADVTGKSNGL